MEDRCVVCGDKIPEGRQVCPNCSGNEGTAFEKLMQNKDVQFEIDDRIEAAYHQGFEAGYSQFETKYWDSQRLIDQYAAERERMKFLLRELLMNQRKNCSDCNVEMLSEECKKRPDGATCFVWKYADEVMELIKE